MIMYKLIRLEDNYYCGKIREEPIYPISRYCTKICQKRLRKKMKLSTRIAYSQDYSRAVCFSNVTPRSIRDVPLSNTWDRLY
jgi:hypothetical protein